MGDSVSASYAAEGVRKTVALTARIDAAIEQMAKDRIEWLARLDRLETAVQTLADLLKPKQDITDQRSESAQQTPE